MRPHKIPLDNIGCGAGDFLLKAQKEGWQCRGIEMAPTLAREANRRLGAESVFTGMLTAAGLPDEEFAAVTIWDALMYSNDPHTDLSDCSRILKNGGIIGIRVRNIFFQKTVRAFYLALAPVLKPLRIKNPSVLHNFCFGRDSIKKLLERSGFDEIQVSNSRLSTGDPYAYAPISTLTTFAKLMIYAFARLVFIASRGRAVIGPSLLIWARKKKECSGCCRERNPGTRPHA